MRTNANLARWLTRAAFLALPAVFAVPFLAAAPRAQSPPQVASNGLQPELQPLSFFLGQWDCAGEFTASKKPTAAFVSVSPDLDGSWIAFRWDDKTPGLFHALELWGFDKNTHEFTNYIHDNFGGVRLFKSPGWVHAFKSSSWDDASFIWTGDAPAGSQRKERFVIQRKPPASFVITWEVSRPGSDWATGDELTCHL